MIDFHPFHISAASALLDYVKKLIRTWPQEFVRALRTSGNESVVELLSPDFLEPSEYDADLSTP
jgi:hypothetical protein